MAATPTTSQSTLAGGGFLIREQDPGSVFTPEDLSEEHRAVARTVDQFWRNEVSPQIEAIEHQAPGVAAGLLRRAAELGLTAILVPEQYGGLEMDLAALHVVAEAMGRSGSFSAWYGAHTGIGTLPLLLFGTPEQKQRYLPRLASAEMIAAYCLSEPQAGSDALAARTRADLSGDGGHYILNGQKMWITNGAAADLYTVFAKIGGEHFTAFLVERAWPGVTPGAEERKMGIKGSSTTPVYFENVRVPKENLLGEAGRGHIIAFNILNLGRLKLGAFVVGGAKEVLEQSIRYAKERKAFGRPIASFGLIQQKLADMAIRIYAAESMTWRTSGLVESHLKGFSWEEEGAAQRMLAAVEEFAAECSMVKVFASEMLDFVTDEGVQIHGGYGYHQDYAVERAYRDSRINRIFEGTNEINRLLITGMLLKRAQRGRLGLVEAVTNLQKELTSGVAATSGSDPLALPSHARKVALMLLGIAWQTYRENLEQEQEILANLSDIVTEVYAMESGALRAAKTGKPGGWAATISSIYNQEALGRIEQIAKTTLAACAEGDTLRLHLTVLKRLTRQEPANTIKAKRDIAAHLIEVSRYAV